MPAPEHTLVRAEDMVLVLIDLQERLAAVMEDRDRVVDRSAKLARAAALVGAPIIMTRQYPAGLGPVVSDLEGLLLELARDGAHVIGVDKVAFSCVAEPSFASALDVHRPSSGCVDRHGDAHLCGSDCAGAGIRSSGPCRRRRVLQP